MHMSRSGNHPQAGFTLLESVFTVVLLAVLGVYAMMKLVTPGTMTLPAQAQVLADLVRRAQSLAMVRGQRMGVSVVVPQGGEKYVAIACASGATPCNTDEALSFSQGVVVGGSTLYFNTLGQPINNAGTPLATDVSFTLSHTSGGVTATHTVTVAVLTGRVSVSP
jgi:prepilin-type N-terminal cleavage/methylation domain-containing protein